MKMQNISNFIKNTGIMGLLGGLGGVASYLYKVVQGKKFNGTMLIVNMVIASIVAIGIGNLIEPMEYNKNVGFVLIMLSGYFSYPILDLIEEHGHKIIEIIKNNFKK